MRAILLAGGLGTRLRPLTESLPKCLVEIADRSLLDIWLDALAGCGVSEVLVNTHHLAHVVEEHVERRRGAPVVRLAHEPVLLGSAGTLLANRRFVAQDDAFLVVNADNLTDFDLTTLLDAHRASGAIATLSVFRTDRPSECGIVQVENGRVVSFEEKPTEPRGNLANAGMYAFSPAVLDLIREPLPRDIGFDVLPALVGRASVVDLGNHYFRDIGTPEALALARSEWGRRASA